MSSCAFQNPEESTNAVKITFFKILNNNKSIKHKTKPIPVFQYTYIRHLLVLHESLPCVKCVFNRNTMCLLRLLII